MLPDFSDFTDFDSFVEAWLTYFYSLTEHSDDDETFWASFLLDEAEHHDPDFCFQLVLAILEKDSSEDVVAFLAAGAIENMLVFKGERAIEILEEYPHKNTLFRKLLYGVWRSNIKDDVWERFQTLRASIPTSDEAK